MQILVRNYSQREEEAVMKIIAVTVTPSKRTSGTQSAGISYAHEKCTG